jgi:uncharacterized repeat protein (TIGR04138 family)
VSDIEGLQSILHEDTRYALEAYLFVLEALYYTRKKYRIEKHVTGQELLEGLKDLALERYGAMTITVFEHWGIHKTIDFGNIVFNMVRKKILSKTEDDSIHDFENAYDFKKVFVNGYKMDVTLTKNKKI